MTDRSNRLADAVRWCALSVAWAAIAGATALIAGVVAGSVALIGFGADSIVDGSASAVLVWRFSAERSGPSHADVLERGAARLVGAILILIGLYLAVAAVLALANHSHPESTVVGAALTAASVLVLPVLARAKLRLAKQLDSSALHGDGVLAAALGEDQTDRIVDASHGFLLGALVPAQAEARRATTEASAAVPTEQSADQPAMLLLGHEWAVNPSRDRVGQPISSDASFRRGREGAKARVTQLKLVN